MVFIEVFPSATLEMVCLLASGRIDGLTLC
jgi:hypothetical protein